MTTWKPYLSNNWHYVINPIVIAKLYEYSHENDILCVVVRKITIFGIEVLQWCIVCYNVILIHEGQPASGTETIMKFDVD